MICDMKIWLWKLKFHEFTMSIHKKKPAVFLQHIYFIDKAKSF